MLIETPLHEQNVNLFGSQLRHNQGQSGHLESVLNAPECIKAYTSTEGSMDRI